MVTSTPRFTTAELLVDPPAHTARARIVLETGERYRFGPTSIEQSVVRGTLVRRYLRYKEGDWYSAEALLRTQFALDDSEYFSLSEVLPGERDRTNRVVPIASRPSRTAGTCTRSRSATAPTPARAGTVGWEGPAHQRPRPSPARPGARIGHRELGRGHVRHSMEGSGAREALVRAQGFHRAERGHRNGRAAPFTVGLTQVRGRWQRVLSATLDVTSTR
jgi:translocation and assembly module TamA